MPFYILYSVFKRKPKGDHKYFACRHACMPPLQRERCHKFAGVKFVHSVADKRALARGQLQ